MTRLIARIAVCAFAFLTAACASGTIAPGEEIPVDLLNASVGVEYRLGAGDKLQVVVFDQEQLSGEFAIDGTGDVSIPLIGEVKASGRTLREFEKALEDKLRGDYLADPRVSAQVLNFRPYYILGEVGSPGEYPYTDGLTVLKAVATAGGFSYRADTRKVFIKRSEAPGEQNLPLTATTPVMPGDTIRVPERYF